MNETGAFKRGKGYQLEISKKSLQSPFSLNWNSSTNGTPKAPAIWPPPYLSILKHLDIKPKPGDFAGFLSPSRCNFLHFLMKGPDFLLIWQHGPTWLVWARLGVPGEGWQPPHRQAAMASVPDSKGLGTMMSCWNPLSPILLNLWGQEERARVNIVLEEKG